jgi:N-acetylmuramoyl-L-alanine amidase
LECPSATIRAQSILLDPGESYVAGEKEIIGELKDSTGRQIPESEADLKIAVVLDSILNSRQGQKVFGTRDLKLDVVGGVISQQTKSVSERVKFINANKDSIMISIHLGKQPKNQNLVKAFVNKDASAASYRLACSLLNSIADKYKMDITGTAIIPVDLAQLKPDDPKQVLIKDSTAVLLEIGNIDYPNNKLVESPVELAQMLALGIDLARTV